MRNAFSLIELMVVIAIIAILSAVAISSYENYLNSTYITQAAELLQRINAEAMQAYNEQTLGTTFAYEGVTLSSTEQTFAFPPAVSATYLNSSNFSGSNEWMFCVNVSGLSFTGYEDPATTSGAYSQLCSKVIANNGVFQTECGQWDTSGSYIPVAYLPQQCNCASISTDTC